MRTFCKLLKNPPKDDKSSQNTPNPVRLKLHKIQAP